MNDANSEHLGRHVVVRLARLSLSGRLIQAGERFLNETDRARAARFRFLDDRRRFMLGRVLLKECLMEYGDCPYDEPLKLILTDRGRPVLAEHPEIQFSLSHSHDLVAVALTINQRVGIDLEAISRQIRLAEIAQRVFSNNDLEAFLKFPVQGSQAAFFRAWTGKEAYLKAQGLGILDGVREVTVPWESDSSSPRAFWPRGKEEAAWSFQSLPLPEGYIGQVVWDDPQKCLDFRVLNPTAQLEDEHSKKATKSG